METGNGHMTMDAIVDDIIKHSKIDKTFLAGKREAIMAGARYRRVLKEKHPMLFEQGTPFYREPLVNGGEKVRLAYTPFASMNGQDMQNKSSIGFVDRYCKEIRWRNEFLKRLLRDDENMMGRKDPWVLHPPRFTNGFALTEAHIPTLLAGILFQEMLEKHADTYGAYSHGKQRSPSAFPGVRSGLRGLISVSEENDKQVLIPAWMEYKRICKPNPGAERQWGRRHRNSMYSST